MVRVEAEIRHSNGDEITEAAPMAMKLVADESAPTTPVAVSGGPLVAGVSTTLTFAAAIAAIYLENNTGEDKHYQVAGAATAGSRLLAAGAALLLSGLDIPVGATTLGIYGLSADPLNGSVGQNLIVEGYA